MTDDRELRLALEHPRGTEQRRLGSYREALRDPARYAALPEADRDAIVAWAALRRRMADRGVDHDAANLADPLIASARLAAFVLEGERLAAGLPTPPTSDTADLLAAVARIRGR